MRPGREAQAKSSDGERRWGTELCAGGVLLQLLWSLESLDLVFPAAEDEAVQVFGALRRVSFPLREMEKVD